MPCTISFFLPSRECYFSCTLSCKINGYHHVGYLPVRICIVPFWASGVRWQAFCHTRNVSYSKWEISNHLSTPTSDRLLKNQVWMAFRTGLHALCNCSFVEWKPLKREYSSHTILRGQHLLAHCKYKRVIQWDWLIFPLIATKFWTCTAIKDSENSRIS